MQGMDGSGTNSRIDLLGGSIPKGLFWLALPIMGSQFIEMAYNLFDTMWVGQMGNQAVTAVGTAWSYMWIAQGLAMIPQIGGQVMAGQSIGEGDMAKARRYAGGSIRLMAVLMLVFTAVCILFRHPLIAFFKLHDLSTVADAESYLAIVSLGFFALGFNFVMQGLLTATGDSTTSFKYKAVGLILNIALDPLMIYGIGPFPKWGTDGAGIATVISETVVAVLFARFIVKDDYLFGGPGFLERPVGSEVVHIAKLGAPPALFSIIFAFITMVTSRFVVAYGDAAIAIQKIGGQIEAVSWMSSDGFAFAMNSFTAQNYGAKKYDRVKGGFRSGTRMMTVYGIGITALLILGAVPVFDIFINEPDIIAGGASYLRIAGLSQLFICYEIVTTGAFNGLGKTKLPAIVSLIATGARVPLFYIFAPIGGLNAIWWVISASSIVKGSILMLAYKRELRRLGNS